HLLMRAPLAHSRGGAASGGGRRLSCARTRCKSGTTETGRPGATQASARVVQWKTIADLWKSNGIDGARHLAIIRRASVPMKGFAMAKSKKDTVGRRGFLKRAAAGAAAALAAKPAAALGQPQPQTEAGRPAAPPASARQVALETS